MIPITSGHMRGDPLPHSFLEPSLLPVLKTAYFHAQIISMTLRDIRPALGEAILP